MLGVAFETYIMNLLRTCGDSIQFPCIHQPVRLNNISAWRWRAKFPNAPSHTQTKTVKTALRPEKLDERSGNVVNTREKSSFQVYSAASLPRSSFKIFLIFLIRRLITRAPCTFHSHWVLIKCDYSNRTMHPVCFYHIPIVSFPIFKDDMLSTPRYHLFCKFLCVNICKTTSPNASKRGCGRKS